MFSLSASLISSHLQNSALALQLGKTHVLICESLGVMEEKRRGVHKLSKEKPRARTESNKRRRVHLHIQIGIHHPCPLLWPSYIEQIVWQGSGYAHVHE